jgi:hypothetical protein
MKIRHISDAIGFVSRFVLRCGLAIAAGMLLLAGSAMAASISVPNGDFSSSTNDGSIGGGVIGGSGSGSIGSGPWQGTYVGVLGLLAPPRLTITNGHATIGGLAGVNVLGIVNNGGYFSQTLTTAYAPNQHYLLRADLDAGVPLDAGVLNDSNAGLALTSGIDVLASTANAAPGIVSLTLLNGTRYRLSLQYDTDATAAGDIGIELFSVPHNLVTANLLAAVSFSNVTLVESAINPVPASIGPASGTPQGATINTAFAAPLVVQVLDVDGDPVAGATVTFSVPGSGPGAILATVTATTDANGLAQVSATANGAAGSYVVSASVGGVATAASFNLTNLAGAASAVASASGTPQSAVVNTAFTAPLGVIVADAGGNPVAGITVAFTAPSSGASATFPGDATATTDASGFAQITPAANTVAGGYMVSAHVNGTGASASFDLTNTAGPAALASPVSGTPQSAQVSTAFAAPLGVIVTDAFGNLSDGVTVTFTTPGSGPSATFPPNGSSTSVVTGPDGLAQVAATANGSIGPYQASATFSGQTNQAVFNLTNTAAPIAQGSATSGDGQSANVSAAFLCKLQIKVSVDDAPPATPMSIDFIAPDSGSSAMLSNGTTSGTQVTATTDTAGLASVTATANSIPGTYTVSAGQHGSGSALASYTLTNLGASERIFADGFEGTPPTLCPGG